ncbi:hypothetical protein [Paraburkholderia phenoliruptrix]|nr:hypothetical protein [Paraburkholderia phenoliruptrix]
MVFMVSRCIEWPEQLPYSPVAWLNPAEIRLLGSLMLTECFEGGPRCIFRPIPLFRAYIDQDLDLTSPITLARIKRSLLDARNHTQKSSLLDAWKAIGDEEFDCFDRASIQNSLQPLFWKAISSRNLVLLRGLYALVKADMLAGNFEFREEATMNTFISLDASHELVLRYLRKNGNPSPTSRDAGTWLYRTFDEPLGLVYGEDVRYFASFYDRRIQTFHPASRHGDMPFAPLEWDDYNHLRSVLPSIFGYLITGQHTPQFHDLTFQARERRG